MAAQTVGKAGLAPRPPFHSWGGGEEGTRFSLSRFLRDDLPTLLIVGLMMLTTGSAVVRSAWADGLAILPAVILTALVMGYLLAISRFSAVFCMAAAGAYGAFTVWVLVGRQITAPLTFRQRLLELGFRLMVWVEQAAGGGYSRDNLIFVLLVALLAWFLTLGALWNAIRLRRMWQAVIPTGIALLIDIYYYNGEANLQPYLLAYLGLTLALAVQTYAVTREQVWREERVGYHPRVRLDLLRGGLIAIALLVAAAWIVPPAPASDRLSALWSVEGSPWRRVEETFERLFGALEGRLTVAPSYYAGSALAMGGPVALGDAPVMRVYAPPGYRYYWRSKVFDTYRHGRWWAQADVRRRSDFGLLPYEEGDAYLLRRSVQQRFEVLTPAAMLLYAAPQPLAFTSLAVLYDAIYTAPHSGEFATVTSVQAREALLRGQSYSVTSSLSIADEASLRAAGTDYPTWVRERYLSLPESVTPRTRELAARLAAPHATPYDAARAIESYLRQHIAYNEQVSAPPPDVEPVDYVLFERPEGYCAYYASAMAVLLRAAGIPARVAVGFAQGTFDAALNAYLVVESDAHAWVEVYFPRYGWVEFEPTATRDPIERADWLRPSAAEPSGEPLRPEAVRPTPAVPSAASGGEGALSSAGEASLRLSPALYWLIALLVVAGGAAIGVRRWMGQRGLLGVSAVTSRYAYLNLIGPLAGVDLHPSDTPYERAEAFRRTVPESAGAVRRIVDLYVREQYTPQRLSSAQRYEADRQARQAWQEAQRVLLQAVLRRWLRLKDNR